MFDAVTGVLPAPQPAEDPVSKMCATGVWRSYSISGVILELLRQMFSAPGNLRHPELQGFEWRGDADASSMTAPDSRIFIEMVAKWNPRIIAMRPALLLKRNAVMTQRTLLGDRASGSLKFFGGSTGVSGIDSGTSHEVMIGGSHTVFCVAREAAGAEALGTEVLFGLLDFSEAIRREVNLGKFIPVKADTVAKIEESGEHWVCPVVVAHGFRYRWSLRSDAPVLKAVSLGIKT